MSPETRSPWRRALAVLGLTALAVLVAQPAWATHTGPVSKKVRFQHGPDIKSWWWERQQDEEATIPVPEGAPITPSQRVRLPSPQRPDTLPVAIAGGEDERMSAIRFDLTTRGVTEGSAVSKFVMTIEESEDRNEHPSVRPGDAKIQACRIDELFVDGENEKWDTRPKVSGDCVQGKRKTPSGKTPFWQFNLTSIATEWGQDPFGANNGVMLMGNIPSGAGPNDTWQVNLKVPSKNVDTTPENDYNRTKNRVKVDLVFLPGDPPAPLAPPDATGFASPGGGFAPSTDFTTSSGSGFDAGTGSGTGTDTTGVEASPAPATPVATAFPQEQAPQVPGYVWALLPLGLLAFSAVRSVVIEPAAGFRPDGVIAAIRRRNAERRGTPLPQPRDLMGSALAATRRGAAATGRFFQGIGHKTTSIVRSVRKR